MDTPYDIKVSDRKSFIKFLELLRHDFADKPTEWENGTLDRFLQDIQGFYDNTNQNINADTPLWTVFADILKGSKLYE